MELNVDLMVKSLPLLIAGAGITVEITAMSVFLGLVIGCMVGIARLCNIKPIRYIANVYVDFIRGTPLLVQIFLVYFALPGIIGSRVDPFVAAISACSINSGAYIAEIFRAGIQSIDKGQMEAEQYGIAVKKDSKLAADINKAMVELKKSGEFDKIYKKWFGDKK